MHLLESLWHRAIAEPTTECTQRITAVLLDVRMLGSVGR
jgi:hypothetical protein